MLSAGVSGGEGRAGVRGEQAAGGSYASSSRAPTSYVQSRTHKQFRRLGLVGSLSLSGQEEHNIDLARHRHFSCVLGFSERLLRNLYIFSANGEGAVRSTWEL